MIPQTKNESTREYISYRNVQAVSIVFSLVLFVAAVARAQAPTASISGIVSDPTGSVVPAVKVTVTDAERGVPFSTQTNQSGVYFVKDLIPSTYKVSAEAPGFRTYVLVSFPLTTTQAAILNITLQLGTASESVEVQSQVQMVEPSNATLGGLMNNAQLANLPLVSRNVLPLMAMVPGVAPSTPNNYSSFSFTAANRYSFNGGNEATSDFQLDGMPLETMSNIPGILAVALTPSLESVQEFRVQTSSYSAAYGRSGGGITSMVTKSGTNAFHGSAFEYLRNTALNATAFFTNRTGASKAVSHVDQYGGSVGGPIIKNNTFFFVTHERVLNHSGGLSFYTLPTALQRQGNFTQDFNAAGQTIQIFNPFTTRPNPSSPGQFVRDPYPNNTIPASLMDPVAVNIIKYYPVPNLPGAPIPGTSNFLSVNNYFASGVSSAPQTELNVKIDHNFNANMRGFARYARQAYSFPYINYYHNAGDPGFGDSTVHAHNVILGLTQTFGAATVLDLRAMFSRFQFIRLGPGYGFDVTTLGLPKDLHNYTLQGSAPQFPVVTPVGYSNLSVTGANDPITNQDTLFQGSLSRVIRRHTLTVGAENRNYAVASVFFSGFVTSFNTFMSQGPNPFTISATAGDSIASLLTGTGSGSSGYYTLPWAYNHYFAQFIQDDFKWTSRLTVNFGFRLEEETGTTERHNRLGGIDPFVLNPISRQVGFDVRGGYIFPGNGPDSLGRRSIRPLEWKPNPRVGLAYSLNDRTVIRAAYGIFFGVPYTSANTQFTSGAFNALTPWIGSLDSVTPLNLLRNPFPSGYVYPAGSSQGLLSAVGTGLGGGWAQALRCPYNQQWNLSIQRNLTTDILLQVAYVGNKGTRLIESQNMNELLPSVRAQGVTDPNSLLGLVPNPFAGLFPAGGTLNAPTVQRLQLLKPWPNWGGVTASNSGWGNSEYNALQVTLQKRYTNGSTFIAGYTRSRLMTDSSDGLWNDNTLIGGGSIRSFYCRVCEHAVSSYDVPNRFTFGGVGELPFGRGKRWGSSIPGLVNQFLGGWQANAIVTLANGQPIIIQAANNNSFSGGGQHPNFTGIDPDLGSAQSIDRWFNTASFSQPANFTYGNMGRTMTAVRADWTRNLDFSLFKNFKIKEMAQVQFRAEAYNLTNTPIFGAPGNSFGSRNFGVVSNQSNPPRNVQLALKIVF